MDSPITRRRMLRLGVGVPAFPMMSSILSACGDDDDELRAGDTTTASTAAPSPTVATVATVPAPTSAPTSTAAPAPTTTTEAAVTHARLVVPEYPFWPNELYDADPALLDELASAYAAGRGASALDAERFLYAGAPLRLFDSIFDGAVEPDGVSGVLWVFHLSGYFGGVWLRREIVAAQPDSLLAGANIEPTETAFRANLARAAQAVEAAGADAGTLLAFTEASLYDVENPENPERPVRGLIDTFGYNQGYLLQIVEAPPEGLTTPPGFVSCEGPLFCEYGDSDDQAQLGALDEFRSAAAMLSGTAAAGTPERWQELGAVIPPLQALAVDRGRLVWSSGLSVQGFPQRSYEQLLDISSSFLQAIQAIVLAAVQSVVESDADLAVRAALANACTDIWLSSYTMGLLDGRADRGIPTFA